MKRSLVLLTLAACGSNPVPAEVDAPLPCGPGTHVMDGVCVADGSDGGIVCGTGTHLEGSTCVPDGPTDYEVRVMSTMIDADGHQRIPVFVIGTQANGTPAIEPVVLNTDRPGAGTFSPAGVTLGAFGAMTTFQPCTAMTAGCTGPLQLTVARASDPTTVVGHVDVELVRPMDIGDPTPCQSGGNVLHIEANDYIYNGILTLSAGQWTGAAGQTILYVQLFPTDQTTLSWQLTFTSTKTGTDILPGWYQMAERANVETAGHPGLEVSGNGHGCSTIAGRFQIYDLERDVNGDLAKATVTFEQRCDNSQGRLTGCVHFEP